MLISPVETARLIPQVGNDTVRASGRPEETGGNVQSAWKQCKQCGTMRPLKSFRIYAVAGRTYTKHSCNVCDARSHKVWYKKNPILQLLQNARQRAKRDKVPFEITVQDVVIPNVCPILGMKLQLGTRRDHSAAPTIDKIVPEFGYVSGNIRVISHRANMLRSNMTISELEHLLKDFHEVTKLKFAAKRMKSTNDKERYQQAPADSTIAS